MAENKTVNERLGLALGDEFEKDMTAILDSDCEQNGENVVLALFDLDHFDHVNKDFGREIGDDVIVATGKHIASYETEGVKAYRIGGDEFGLIFKGELEKEDVFLILEDIRKNFLVTLPDGEEMKISVGMAVAFEDANRYQEIVRKAESALYRAKYAGRDRVAMAKEEKMVPKTSHYTSDQLKRLAKLSKREGVGEAILLREALDMLIKKYDV